MSEILLSEASGRAQRAQRMAHGARLMTPAPDLPPDHGSQPLLRGTNCTTTRLPSNTWRLATS